jgi:NADPH:quinone reductase-like Zn-dependent oxidoreductase
MIINASSIWQIKNNNKQMKALRINNYGTSSVMNIEEIDLPETDNSMMLIKVHASSVNPLDWKIRNGELQDLIPIDFPITLGWDFAGVVIKTGKDVKQFKIGDKVYGRPEVTNNGSHAEYIAVKEYEIAHMPQSITFEEAASLPIACITAWEALFKIAELKPNQRVLIHAGSGSLGSIAIQLAKHIGAYVITTASSENEQFLKSLGADEIIDYKRYKFEDFLGKSVDVVLDSIGNDVQKRSYKVLKKTGILVAVNTQPDKNYAIEYGIRAEFLSIKPNGKLLKLISDLIENGNLKPVVGQIFNFEDLADAFNLSESGNARGKIVLTIQ